MKTFKQYLLEATEKKIIKATGVNGSGVTTVTYEDGSTSTLTGPRPIRNNNPGNLEYGKFAISQGAVGSDGRYAVFPTKQTGWNAKVNLLRTKTYQSLTLKDAFNRYAPPSENPNYLRDLQAYTGFDLSRPMNSLSTAEFDQLIRAVAKIEGAGSYLNTYPSSSTPPSVDADEPSQSTQGTETETNPGEEKQDFTSGWAIGNAVARALGTLKDYAKYVKVPK